MRNKPCHYCGRRGVAVTCWRVVCSQHTDLPRLEPSEVRDRPPQRLRRRGLAG